VIAVDDRSSDRTGAILDELARTDPRLTVLHVSALPAGWLGKNHALHLAGQAARGDWLLFTDADVHLAPDALSRAIAHAERAGLDHLAVGPRIRGGSPGMRMLLVAFALCFALITRPWRAADPAREEHIGIGAFNLVRRRALAAVGFHARLALRPDDDVKLGKVLKQAGFRQGFLKGDALVEVEWYRTAPEMVRGLEKNSFAFLGYSVPRTLAAVLAIALLALFPLAAAWSGGGALRALSLASVAVALLLSWGSATRGAALPGRYALGYPLAALLLIVTILNSMLRTLLQGGVRWRGTLYPLAALRANDV
jgi:glycosyltransferase involved in cell wall biosynthesis